MTGMDLDRVFVSRREPLALPQYKLMNEQQLKKVTSPKHTLHVRYSLAGEAASVRGHKF